MYAILNQAHYLNRYLILAALLFVIVRSLMGWLGKKEFTNTDDKGSLLLFISTHIQLLLGLLLYFVYSPIVQNAKLDIKAAMKNPDLRYFVAEHFAAMLFAIILITLGRILMKKAKNDTIKHRRLAIYNIIAFAIVVGSLIQGGILLGHKVAG